MPLETGTQLGAFEILSPLDAGGDDASRPSITLALNWTEELTRLVPVQ